MISKKKVVNLCEKHRNYCMITNKIFSTIANQDKKSYITFAQKQEFIHDPEQIISQPLQKQAELMQDVGQIIFATFAKKHRN